jgi:hypothetical protein
MAPRARIPQGRSTTHPDTLTKAEAKRLLGALTPPLRDLARGALLTATKKARQPNQTQLHRDRQPGTWAALIRRLPPAYRIKCG